jgi:hypothetical protein
LKWFGAQIDVDPVVTVLDDRFPEGFPGPEGQQIHFVYQSLDFCLCVKVILR